MSEALIVPPAESPTELKVSKVLEQHSDRLVAVLPEMFPAQRFNQLCLSALRKNKTLQNCNFFSLLDSMMGAAVLGLEPDTPAQQCFLIPYASECTLQLGYQGLITIAGRADINITCVDELRENDEFVCGRGTHPELTHHILTPHLKERGELLWYYCCHILSNGNTGYSLMTEEEVNDIRDFALSRIKEAWKREKSPWMLWPKMMAFKTVAKRDLKYLAKFAPAISTALDFDGRQEAGKYVTGEFAQQMGMRRAALAPPRVQIPGADLTGEGEADERNPIVEQ
ncbi:MAG: recombinase RecT [Pseudomonadota bacterium]